MVNFTGMDTIRLKKGKDKAVRQMHPWVFSGAIDHIKGKPQNGSIVDVTDHTGILLARGYYNDQSRVAIRLLEWDMDTELTESWWKNRIRKAVEARQSLNECEHTNTYRLVFSEADFLPGLIVDRYAGFLSVQVLTSGIELVKPILFDELNRLLEPEGIFDRSDTAARAHDGLPPSGGLAMGIAPPGYVTVKENEVFYQVNIIEGQKSGFYCDQRHNRQVVAAQAPGKKVLDCFCYSGGFTVNCMKQGAAKVISVDSSAAAINTLKRNIEINALQHVPQQAIVADVNKQLREFKNADEKFDLIILDPPKYAPSRSSLDKAARAYKDLNRLALGLLESGGLLATFSCSGAVDIALFKQILAWAALDAGKQIQFIYQFGQPADHPVRASFPEGEYLKGLLCRVC